MSDIYLALSDSAINRVVRFLMRWRPSLFNYVAPAQHWALGSTAVPMTLQDRWVVCVPVQPPPGVAQLTFPLYTKQEPIQIPAFPLGAPYCIQITDLEVDFEPSNRITLPAETGPLQAQQFGVRVKASAGLGCPPDALIDELLQGAHVATHSLFFHPVLDGMALDVDALHCFSLELFVTGHLYTEAVSGPPPATNIRAALDSLEVVDLSPSGLEDAAECYIRMVIRGYVLPRLVVKVAPIVESILGVTLAITPSLSPALPNNPAVEQDELRVWLDISL